MPRESIGGINFSLAMDLSRLRRNIKSGQRLIGKFVSTTAKALTGLAVGVALGATAAFAGLTAMTIKSMREIAQAVREGKANTLAITESQAVGVLKAVEAWGKLKKTMMSLFQFVAASLAPLMEVVADNLNSFLNRTGVIKSAGKAVGNFVIEAVKKMADVGQQAFASLLKFAAAGLEFFNSIRSGKLAGKLGLTAPSVEEFQAPLRLRNRANFLSDERNRPSLAIQNAIDSRRHRNFGQVAVGRGKRFLGGALDFGRNLASTPGQVLNGITSNPANRLLGTLAKDFLSGSQEKIANLLKLPGLQAEGQSLKAQLAGLQGKSASPAFSFTQAGSADSFRQKAAAKRLNEENKIRRQQRDLLKKIAKNTEQQQQLQAANL